MVKDDPNWQTVIQLPRPSKRTKNNESSAYTSSFNANTSVGLEHDEVEVCPISQNAVKEMVSPKGRGKHKRAKKKTPPICWTKSG